MRRVSGTSRATTLGAQSVNPNIKVTPAYVTRDFSAKAFHDQAGGKAFAEQLPHDQPQGWTSCSRSPA